MEKILVFGNEQTRKWSESINNSQFIQMPVFSLGEMERENFVNLF